MPTPTIMFVGHSHVYAIEHALRQHVKLRPFHAYTLNVIGRPQFVNYAAIVNGERVFNPEITAEMDADVPLSDQMMFVGMFGGNAYNAVGLFLEEPDYDFYVWGEVQEAEFEERSAADVRETLLAEAIAAIEHISLLRQTKAKPMVVLSSPPPIEDNAFISANLGHALAEIRQGRAIARPTLRKKLYIQHTEIFRTHCESIGVPFIAPPAETVTPDGYLKPEYWSDATHANAAYGELQYEQVKQFARQHQLMVVAIM